MPWAAVTWFGCCQEATRGCLTFRKLIRRFCVGQGGCGCEYSSPPTSADPSTRWCRWHRPAAAATRCFAAPARIVHVEARLSLLPAGSTAALRPEPVYRACRRRSPACDPLSPLADIYASFCRKMISDLLSLPFWAPDCSCGTDGIRRVHRGGVSGIPMLPAATLCVLARSMA